VVEEALCCRNGEPVKGAGAADVHVRVEGRRDFSGHERASLHERKGDVVDGEFGAGDLEVASDGAGRRARGPPVAFVLGDARKRAEEGCGDAEQYAGLHNLRMTPRGGVEQTERAVFRRFSGDANSFPRFDYSKYKMLKTGCFSSHFWVGSESFTERHPLAELFGEGNVGDRAANFS